MKFLFDLVRQLDHDTGPFQFLCGLSHLLESVGSGRACYLRCDGRQITSSFLVERSRELFHEIFGVFHVHHNQIKKNEITPHRELAGRRISGALHGLEDAEKRGKVIPQAKVHCSDRLSQRTLRVKKLQMEIRREFSTILR